MTRAGRGELSRLDRPVANLHSWDGNPPAGLGGHPLMGDTTRRSIHTIIFLLIAAAAARPAAAQYELKAQPYVTGLSRPLGFVQDPGDPTVQYVVEQGGRIRAVQNGVLLGTDFLDVSSSILSTGEQGLLGLAFPPDYAASGRFYINYTESTHGDTVVARYKRSSTNPPIADPASEKRMVWSTGLDHIGQPFGNHNGGHLAFGPDGYLYIAVGDGGGTGDPFNNAQTPGTLLGKMLRIDVSVDGTDMKGFRVPADNPFLADAAYAPEIWDVGLRNPWQFVFDGATGGLVIADVGQDSWEEIDYEPAVLHGHMNYGWSLREGGHDYAPTTTPAFVPLVDPIFEYDHSVGHAIIGGPVYRGTNLGAIYSGRYFFADFVDARVWSIALTLDASGSATASDLREHTDELGGDALGNISAFGTDAAGEVYIVAYTNGTIFRVSSGAPILRIETPANGTSWSQPLVLRGWAIDRRATTDAGIDTIHFYAFPNPGSGTPPVFLGFLNANDFENRTEVAALYGPQFVHSGFRLVRGGFEPGSYLFAAYARNTATGQFATVAMDLVTLQFSELVTLSSDVATFGDRMQPLVYRGWIIDRSADYAPTHFGTGIDSVWLQFVDTTTGATTFLRGDYGIARPDVAAVYGSRYVDSGYSFEIRDLKPGQYAWRMFAWDALTNDWVRLTGLPSGTVNVLAGPMLRIDAPSAGTTIAQPFDIGGWALDLRATSGTGVDAIHVYAYPASGGPPVFVGFGSPSSRPDVAAIFGSHFLNSGYNTTVRALPTGTYTLVVWVHSSVTNFWAINRTVTVTIQ
jgi:glucose/arabinose dehydrogenase